MRKLFLLTGLAAMAASAPALAGPPGGHPRGCPPGLAKKNNGCMPPGQAKRMFREGQRIPSSYDFYVDYDGIPVAYRDRIPESYRDGYRYIYRDDSVYVVDPTTRLVRTIIDLID